MHMKDKPPTKASKGDVWMNTKEHIVYTCVDRDHWIALDFQEKVCGEYKNGKKVIKL